MYSYIVLFIVAYIGISLIQKLSSRWKKLPPGPYRIPGIGCIIQMGLLDSTNAGVTFQKMSKEYGDVISIQIGTIFAVVINGQEHINSVFQNEDCLSRVSAPWILHRNYGNKTGLTTSSDKVWRETHNFVVANLPHLRPGLNNSMETRVVEEFDEFVGRMMDESNIETGLTEMTNIFNEPIINIIWSIVTGKQNEFDDPKLIQLHALIKSFVKTQHLGVGTLGAYPFLATLAPKLTGYEEAKKSYIQLQDFIKELIDSTRKNGMYRKNPTNFIELFLNKIDGIEGNPKSSIEKEVFSDKNLIITLLDLFIAGVETTTSALSFSILFLILNPNVQEKMRQEIKEVVGFHRVPNQEDMANMKYTQATILEIFRMSSVASIVPRRNKNKMHIGNHTIPADTLLLLNCYSVHMDEKTWENPSVFQPERFLNENQDIIRAKNLLVFGAGAQNCSGESLARMIIFTFITGLLQKYKFEINPLAPKPSTTAHFGTVFALRPKPYSAVVKPMLVRRASRPWEFLD